MNIAPVGRPRPQRLSPQPRDSQSEIDFAVLDKSEEALLMPILDPSFQLALSSCLKDHLSGEPSARTESEIQYKSQFGEIMTNQNFTLESSDDRSYVSLTGGGELAGEKSFDAGTVKKKSGSWWGGYGANTYDLDMVKTPFGYHIWGSLGKLGCRVKVTETADGLVTEGKIGGRTFHQKTTTKNEKHFSEGQLQAEKRGQEAESFSRDYESQEQQDDKEIIEGGGQIFAGVQSSWLLIDKSPSS